MPTTSGNMLRFVAYSFHSNKPPGTGSSVSPGLAATLRKDLPTGHGYYVGSFVRAPGRHGRFCPTGALQTPTSESPSTTMHQPGWNCSPYTAMVRSKVPLFGQRAGAGPAGVGQERTGWGGGCRADARGTRVPAESELQLGEEEVTQTRGESLAVSQTAISFQ